MSSQSSSKNAAIRSTWTPMSNDETNAKYFDQRRQLIMKWCEKWTDEQRKAVIDDLLSLCKLQMLEQVAKELEPVLPKRAVDFTLMLPQNLVLNIFSYLDPRSLCRCSQVNTHWKWVAEHDALWLFKCAKLGWTLSFEPTPFERGVWKANYVEHFKQLQQAGLLREPDRAMLQLEAANSDRSDTDRSSTHRSALSAKGGLGAAGKRAAAGQRPWRAPDKSPMDTWRYNYLDERELENASKKPAAAPAAAGSATAARRPPKSAKARDPPSLKFQPSSELQRSSSLDRLAELTANELSRVANAEMMFVAVAKEPPAEAASAPGPLSQSVALGNRPLWAQPRSVQGQQLLLLNQPPTQSSRPDAVQASSRSILSTNGVNGVNGNGKSNGVNGSSKPVLKTRFRNDSDVVFSPKPWNTNAASGSSNTTPANSQR